MFLTFETFQPETPNKFRDSHLLNIAPMSVTLPVLKPVTLSVANEVHPWNISAMLVTFEVLKLDTSSEVRLLHPLNMALMVVTFSHVNREESVRVSKESQAWNMPSISAALEVSKEDRSSDVKAVSVNM